MRERFALGLDFGTNSVRALIVDVNDGRELANYVCNYPSGNAGIYEDPDQPDLARQHPSNYIQSLETAISIAMEHAAADGNFSRRGVIGIGVDTTGSTPLPIDARGAALTQQPKFAADLNAMAWLWKDHTAHAEAEEITALAQRMRPNYLAKCGGRYSSEWFWAKLLHCARVAPEIFAAAYSWVEIADWIPFVLTGQSKADAIRRGICAAGHKAMFNRQWGGYPDEQFLAALHPDLVRVRKTLPDTAGNVGESAGALSAEWAHKFDLQPGIPIAIGAFDAHLGAIGAGISEGTLVKIIGTSTCDIMISPMDHALADVPGLCGIVPESVLPGFYGLEAGQSAVGDIFNWFVNTIQPRGVEAATHQALSEAAEQLRPGQSGLLALDWHNGNRTVLVDQRLSGLMVGMNLHTKPAEIYRALIESTAFGARTIVSRLEEYGVPVKRVVNCGGIAARNPLVMQIYADVLNLPLSISRSMQTCALGSAIAASVVAGTERGGHASFSEAVGAMTSMQERAFHPIAKHVAIYDRIYQLYRQLHDAFGVPGHQSKLANVMKDLLAIRDSV